MVLREMAVGNTFGATALSSYGGFWIAYAILNTPHWNILGQGGPYKNPDIADIDPKMADSAVGFFLTGWFIFTTILLLCTLRSTVMFFLLFFTLDLAFLMLSCGHYAANNGNASAALSLQHAGGGFGMIAAFLAWYNAFAGIADSRYDLFPLFCLFLPFLPWPFLPQGICPPTQSIPFSAANLESCGQDRDHGCIGQATDRKPPSSLQAPMLKTPCPTMSSQPLRQFWLTQMSNSNSFFLIPVFHFPWSEKGREARLAKSASHTSNTAA